MTSMNEQFEQSVVTLLHYAPGTPGRRDAGTRTPDAGTPGRRDAGTPGRRDAGTD